MTAAGGILAYSAIINQSPANVLRSLLLGQQPTSRPSDLEPARQRVTGELGAAVSAAGAQLAGGVASVAGGGTGAAAAAGNQGEQLVAFAREQIGKKYVFGTAGPNTFDCSGLVTYLLVQKMGLRNLPSLRHTVTMQFYVWNGATTVSRPPIAGDLICWTGHIAIAVNATRMIAAPNALKPVQEQNIYWTGSPLVRRIKWGAS